MPIRWGEWLDIEFMKKLCKHFTSGVVVAGMYIAMSFVVKNISDDTVRMAMEKMDFFFLVSMFSYILYDLLRITWLNRNRNGDQGSNNLNNLLLAFC